MIASKPITDSPPLPASEKPGPFQMAALPLSWPVIVLLAGLFLYVSPYAASDLPIIPDSIEYAVGAQRFATLGHFNIVINGTIYPSRYTPWFSILFLSPLYRLFPTHLGIGILVVFALALCAVTLAFCVGRRLSGEWGGMAAAIGILIMPCFASCARSIMSDVPFCAIGLLGAWVFMALAAQPKRWHWVLAAFVPALAFAVRPVGPALLLPFLFYALFQRGWRSGGLLALLLCVPTAFLALATCLYNQHEFGRWNCTGYQFWDGTDYEFSHVTFSPAYLHQNIVCFFGPQARLVWGLAAVGAALLWRSRRAEARPLLLYAAFGALPITLFYLFYEFTDLRFQILLLALGACLAAGGLAVLIPSGGQAHRWAPAVCALALLGTLVWHHDLRPQPPPARRMLADAIAQETPRNAIVITSLEPVYLEPLVQRGTARRVIPIDPSIEYGARYVDPHPIPRRAAEHPPNWLANFPAYAKSYGWRRVVPWTAIERPDLVAAMVQSGLPVYLCLPPSDPRWQAWREHYQLVLSGPQVARLEKLGGKERSSTQ